MSASAGGLFCHATTLFRLLKYGTDFEDFSVVNVY
jgi:hypothetical protein